MNKLVNNNGQRSLNHKKFIFNLQLVQFNYLLFNGYIHPKRMKILNVLIFNMIKYLLKFILFSLLYINI